MSKRKPILLVVLALAISCQAMRTSVRLAQQIKVLPDVSGFQGESFDDWARVQRGGESWPASAQLLETSTRSASPYDSVNPIQTKVIVIQNPVPAPLSIPQPAPAPQPVFPPTPIPAPVAPPTPAPAPTSRAPAPRPPSSTGPSYIVLALPPPQLEANDSDSMSCCDTAQLEKDRADVADIEAQVAERQDKIKTQQEWLDRAQTALKKMMENIASVNKTMDGLNSDIGTLEKQKQAVVEQMKRDKLLRDLDRAKEALDDLQQKSESLDARVGDVTSPQDGMLELSSLTKSVLESLKNENGPAYA